MDLYNQVQWIEDEGKTRLGCGTGFTDIGIGCLQTSEQGSTSAFAASQNCHSTYGGRLPTPQELSLGFNNYALTAETDDNEWTGQITFESGQKCVYMDADVSFTTFGAVSCSNTGAYRCFLPYGNDYE